MTALNFPNSPSNGDTYQGYTYNSAKSAWAKPEGSSTTVVANVAALPASASVGDQAFVSATNRLYLWNGSGWYNIALLNNAPSISGVNATYDLANDGTATTVTITAADPEGLPIIYSIASDTSGNIAAVTQGTGSNTNVFTITPSTNTAHAGTFSLTFRASDGVNIASSAASFTLQFRVTNSHYTTALFTSVGANNAVNNSFDDKSTSDHTIAANGDIHQTTFSPYRHGGYSVYFDGSGDYLASDSNNIANFGTGDFTVEGWFYLRSLPGSGTIYSVVDARSSGGNATGWTVGIGASGNIYIYNAATTISGGSISTGAWYHWAFTRSGNDQKLFLNGTQVGSTYTTARNFTDTKWRVAGSHSGGELFSGYQRDVRVIKGTALYTSNFTPSTEPLTAVTNTTFLGCHLPYFKDGSTNDHTIAINGDPSIEPFAPFDYQEYAVSDHSGSLHSDGSGDYLAVDASSDFDLGTSDFTIEGWVYPTSYGNANFLLGQNYFSSVLQINSGKLQFYSSPASAYIITAATDIRLNAWTHWAVVRNGNAWTIYLNGKSDATATNAADAGFDSTNPLHIMRWNNSNGTIAGNVADFRFVKGTAVYTSNFTPPTAPLTAVTNTKLLVQSTDAGIINKAQSAGFVKLVGNTKSSTTQTKFLSSSMYFDGTGDYVNAENFDIGNVGTAPFTFEGWFYLTASPSNYITIVQTRASNASQAGFVMAISASDFYVYSGAFIGAKGSAISSNQWYHWAYARDPSGNQRVFLNGTQTGSTYTTARNYTEDKLWIGAKYDGSEYFTGYQSDIRITKGLARYTANFTAPTAALKG